MRKSHLYKCIKDVSLMQANGGVLHETVWGGRVRGWCFSIKKIVFLALEVEVALKSELGSALSSLRLSPPLMQVQVRRQ